MRYFIVPLSNIDNIIRECREKLSHLEQQSAGASNLWYPQYIPEMPYLEAALKRLNMYREIFGIAFHVTMPGVEIPIHVDSGPIEWSLNIPVYSFDDSSVVLYNTDEKPVHKILNNGVTYWGFEKRDKLTVVDVLPSGSTILLNVKKPHNVINSSMNKRIMLLIRLKRSFDLNSFLLEINRV